MARGMYDSPPYILYYGPRARAVPYLSAVKKYLKNQGVDKKFFKYSQ